MYYRFYRGENLEEVLADVPQVMELLRRSENTVAQTLLRVLAQNIRALSGLTASATDLNGDDFDEAAFLQATKGIRVFHVYYHVLKQPLAFTAGEFKRSLDLAEAALPLMPGMYFITEHALLPFAGARGRWRRRPASSEPRASQRCARKSRRSASGRTARRPTTRTGMRLVVAEIRRAGRRTGSRDPRL